VVGVIRRLELADSDGDLVPPLLTRTVLGRPRPDEPTMLNGIVWKFRAQVAWRDVHKRYGSWASLHTRFRRWAADGTFDRMLQAAQARADAPGNIDCWCLVTVTRPLGPGDSVTRKAAQDHCDGLGSTVHLLQPAVDESHPVAAVPDRHDPRQVTTDRWRGPAA
jgi:transposase